MNGKITSVLILISSIVMVISGVVVFFSPHSHVAGFSGWKFMNLGKRGWMSLHVDSALLFAIVFFFHVWFNLKPLMRYLFPKKTKARKDFIPLIISLAISIYVIGGTFYPLPPMTQVLKLGRSFKINGAFSYGPVPPPYGAASLVPLKKISFYIGTRPQKIIEYIKKSGIKNVSPTQSLKEIAEKNNVTIGFILDSINKNSTADNQM